MRAVFGSDEPEPPVGKPVVAEFLGVPEATLGQWTYRRIGPPSCRVGRYRRCGLDRAEVVEHRPGVDWVVDRLAGMVAKNRPCAVVLDGASLAASLLPAVREAGLDPLVTTARAMAQACGGFYTPPSPVSYATSTTGT